MHRGHIDRFFRKPFLNVDPSLAAACHLALTLSLLCKVSRKKCNYVLACLRFIIRRLLDKVKDPFIRLDSIPRDIRTLLRRFDLDPVVTSYVCCPTCYCLYKETDQKVEFCAYKAFQNSDPCGSALFEVRSIGGKDHTVAIRKYLHQDFKSWHARLLSRPDIEAALDKAARSASQVPYQDPNRVVHDILESDIVQQFLGPDGKRFIEAPEGELRFIWGFGFDGFDPHHAKPGRASISTNGLYVLLMSLPPDLRLQQDNMFLAGAIAGKPTLDEINHYARLVVDDMLDFWEPGVYFSRTSRYARGRLSLGALLPMICDLLAARQISGFPSPNATYLCSVCEITQDDIENLIKGTWKFRTYEGHCAQAQRWLTLESEDARKRFIRDGGVRWTEFLRLPYWRPNLFTVLESMHAHNLRNLRHHIWVTWGMNSASISGDGQLWYKRDAPPCPIRSNATAWQEKLKILQTGSEDKLRAQRYPVLWHLCHDLDLRRAGSKRMLARNLLSWVCVLLSIKLPLDADLN